MNNEQSNWRVRPVIARSPQFKAMLLRALRGGKYKQTAGTWRSRDCFCINGVAIDVAMQMGLPGFENLAWHSDLPDKSYCRLIDKRTGQKSKMDPPKASVKLLGTASLELQSRNDHRGQGFKEMANYIERAL